MRTSGGLEARLMLMMFLQFFIWGAWYATGGNYMKSHGLSDAIYLAYMASPIGSIVAPFFCRGYAAGSAGPYSSTPLACISTA